MQGLAACGSLPHASGGAVFSHASSFLRRVALSARHGARKAEGDFAPAFPSLCDKNASSLIEPQEALLLGLLLSVDSFAIGLSAAAGGINVTLLPLFSALFQTFFLALGEKCGARLILSPAPKESLWSLLSGGILILLAVLQLLDKK